MSILGSIMRLPAILDEVGITKADLRKALRESPYVRAATIEKAEEVKKFWVNNIKDMTRPAHPIQKGSDHIIEQGDYKKSIQIKWKYEDSLLVGIVYSNRRIAPHAYWVEYGSIHNPQPLGTVQKIMERFGGVEEA